MAKARLALMREVYVAMSICNLTPASTATLLISPLDNDTDDREEADWYPENETVILST